MKNAFEILETEGEGLGEEGELGSGGSGEGVIDRKEDNFIDKKMTVNHQGYSLVEMQKLDWFRCFREGVFVKYVRE